MKSWVAPAVVLLLLGALTVPSALPAAQTQTAPRIAASDSVSCVYHCPDRLQLTVTVTKGDTILLWSSDYAINCTSEAAVSAGDSSGDQFASIGSLSFEFGYCHSTPGFDHQNDFVATSSVNGTLTVWVSYSVAPAESDMVVDVVSGWSGSVGSLSAFCSGSEWGQPGDGPCLWNAGTIGTTGFVAASGTLIVAYGTISSTMSTDYNPLAHGAGYSLDQGPVYPGSYILDSLTEYAYASGPTTAPMNSSGPADGWGETVAVFGHFRGTGETRTQVACQSPIMTGASSVCAASVSGAIGSIDGESVTFSASGAGTFSPAGTCTLSSGSCSVTYTPVTGPSQMVTASYGGDANNTASSGTAEVIITPSLSITASYNPVLTTIAIQGMGYAPLQTYYYCYEGYAPAPTGCDSSYQFTTPANGQIPAGLKLFVYAPTGLVVVSMPPVGGQVVTSVFFTSVNFTVQGPYVPTTVGLSGCSVYPRQLPANGAVHVVQAKPACTLTAHLAGTSSYRFVGAAGGTVLAIKTCPLGSCSVFAAKIHKQFHVTFVVRGRGTVSVVTGWFSAGARVYFRATPATGHHFVRWSSSSALVKIASYRLPSTSAVVKGAGTITAFFS